MTKDVDSTISSSGKSRRGKSDQIAGSPIKASQELDVEKHPDLQEWMSSSVQEEAKKFITFGIAEDAKAQVKSWATWTIGLMSIVLGAISLVFVTLGIKTYMDLDEKIGAATDKAVQAASGQASDVLSAFSREQTTALKLFQTETEEALKKFKKAKEALLEKLEVEGKSAIEEIKSTKAETEAAILALAPDSIEATAERRTVNRQGRQRPIGPGISVSSPDTTVGTLCCIVSDDAGNKYILTANFVISTGDDEALKGTAIIQPGKFDGGTVQDGVAKLTALSSFNFSGSWNNTGGAIARIDDGIDVYYDIPEIGPLTGVAETVKVGQILKKYGRTTGLTEGKVSAIDTKESIGFGQGRTATFKELIALEGGFSAAGDSGAPVVNEKGQLVGMLYARSQAKSLVLPIKPTLEELSVELLTGAVEQ